MKLLQITFLIFCFITLSLSQNNISFFERSDLVFYDSILQTEDGIWLMEEDYNDFTLQPVKYDKSNNIFASGPKLPLWIDENDLRFRPSFLGADTLNNIYYFNATNKNESATSINILKISSDGTQIWNSEIDKGDDGILLTSGEIIDSLLICSGFIYNFENEMYNSYIVVISIETGSVIWENSTSSTNLNAYFDLSIINSDNIGALKIGLDPDDNYLSVIDLFNIKNGSLEEINIPLEDFFASQIEFFNENKCLISGFLYSEDQDIILLFDLTNSSIIWETELIYNAWDDVNIFIMKSDDRIYTCHNKLDDELASGSSFEIVFSSYDFDGNLIDTFLIDKDENDYDNISNCVLGSDGNIYFCGYSEIPLTPNFYAYWGFFNANEVLTSTKNVNPDSGLVNMYPNIALPGQIINFDSDIKINSIQIMDINQNSIVKYNIGTEDCIKIPYIPSGLYLVNFINNKGNLFKKLFIK